MSAVQFVEAVARLRLPSVFNPYSDRCPHFDLPDAPVRRRQNLTAQLEAALSAGVDSIWIARDLGYRGGRRTGVALTDEAHLTVMANAMGEPFFVAKATMGPVVSERTAGIVWGVIQQLQVPVFTWNVFPLHPHNEGDQLTNRCHTRIERRVCQPLLLQLLDLLKPSKIIAIGNDAAAGLDDLGIECLKVRHPSYGGQSEFVTGMRSLHGCDERARQPEAAPTLL